MESKKQLFHKTGLSLEHKVVNLQGDRHLCYCSFLK